ncbi:MAG: hypothetical protein JNL13_02695 [Chitinophagaceae bacterium]|nr:hypothetical protein [Chitinophagaceae bacterium]
MKYTDTASMLTPYATKAKVLVDSVALAANINQRVKYTDTAAMLAPYATKANLKDTASVLRSLISSSGVDTTSLSNRINQRVKYSDTAAMLAPYVHYTDTAAMLSNYINSATNGITQSGKSVKLGGTLSEATTITTSAANTLSLAGLQGAATTDSVLMVTSAGVVKRIAANRIGGSGSGWSLTGNSGTTAGTNFIGTTDGQDLIFKVNSVESGKITAYNNSTAFGSTAAAAYRATAIGYGASASTNNAVAVGYNTAASGQDGVAIGNAATASANATIAIGKASATTQDAIAIGNAAVANGSNESIAIGKDAKATSYRSLAVGSDAKASNNNSVAIGYSVSAGGQQSTAIGNATSATGTNSTVIGYGATTTQNNAVILGNSNASVGIGNSAPNNKLEITQGTTGNSGLRLTNLNSSYAGETATGNSSKTLTVNTNGDVVLTNGLSFVNSTSGTSYTLSVADNQEILYFTSGSAITITVPNTLPAGFTVAIVQGGDGQITFSGTRSNVYGQYKSAGKFASLTIQTPVVGVNILSGETN